MSVGKGQRRQRWTPIAYPARPSSFLSRQDVDKKKGHMQINRYCKYSIYREDWQGQKRDNCRTREMGVKKQLDEGHPPPTVDEGHPHPGGGRIKRASYAKQPCCCCCCSQRRQWLSHGVLPSTCSVVCTLVS